MVRPHPGSGFSLISSCMPGNQNVPTHKARGVRGERGETDSFKTLNLLRIGSTG